MRVLYFDCFAGISGDMAVASLIDLGVPRQIITDELRKLRLDGYALRFFRENKNGISSLRFDVALDDEACAYHEHDRGGEHGHHEHNGHGHTHEHHHRNLSDIRGIIASSDLSLDVIAAAMDIFTRIALAESKIHGVALEEVNFHEVGAVDSIVDIVAFSVALRYLAPDLTVCSVIREGSGFVRCQHGKIPVPAPATLAILSECGAVLNCTDIKGEMVTPTGAGIIAAACSQFGRSCPSGTVAGTGYGAGMKNFEHPNVLRTVLVETESEAGAFSASGDTISVLECNIDDATGEQLGYAMELLMSKGALDVSMAAITMKKSRPGVMLSVLCPVPLEDMLCALVLEHTPTLGVRIRRSRRVVMARSFTTVDTPYGPVRMKVSQWDSPQFTKAMPEYESLKECAECRGVTLDEVRSAAISAWRVK